MGRDQVFGGVVVVRIHTTSVMQKNHNNVNIYNSLLGDRSDMISNIAKVSIPLF